MIQSRDLIHLWNNFFFNPEPASTMGLFRILFGLIVFIDSIRLLKTAKYCFGINGCYPFDYWIISNHALKRFSLLKWLPKSDRSLYFVLYSLILSSFFLTVGCFTTLSAIVVWVCLTSLAHRNIYVLHSGDTLMRLLSFLLIFSSSGYGLSVDNYLNDRYQYSSMISPWAHRLMMVQMSVVYLWSLKSKLLSKDWINGSAVYYALCYNSLSRRLFSSKYLKSMCTGIQLSSWTTLFLEFFISVGVWFKEFNVWAILAGIMFHLWLDINLKLGTFSWIMIVGLLLFVDPVMLSEWLYRIL